MLTTHRAHRPSSVGPERDPNVSTAVSESSLSDSQEEESTENPMSIGRRRSAIRALLTDRDLQRLKTNAASRKMWLSDNLIDAGMQ